MAEVAGKPYSLETTIHGQYALTGSELAGVIALTGICMPDESTAMAQPFEIVSVQRAQPPHGVEGTDWHRYIIVQGTNTIQGYRQGNLGAVTRAVEEIVVQLNERRIGKRGRVNLVMPTWKKPAGK